MGILFEDDSIIAAVKPADAVSEFLPDKSGFADLLAAHTGGYIGVIHRLDRGVGGVMIYAKTPSAAAILSRAVQDRSMKKEYLALVHGSLHDASGEWRDLLFHDSTRNKTFVVDRERKGVKEAILRYRAEKGAFPSPYGEITSVNIELLTGRTHQIRAQFSSRGYPLVGDRKYGAKDQCPIGLFCRRITLLHPVTKAPLVLEAHPAAAPFAE